MNESSVQDSGGNLSQSGFTSSHGKNSKIQGRQSQHIKNNEYDYS